MTKLSAMADKQGISFRFIELFLSSDKLPGSAGSRLFIAEDAHHPVKLH
jgi:hypothetical protein